ncbi:hypothetical protein ABIB62_002303 [Mucilaginibacter sp. UYP25]|uniref:hypothetical protein n=1 Tax=unclassified Mucilaginibacter TaxID=2617802 RepID=UPI00339110EB
MDGDHIVAASQAIRDYRIKKVIWGGYDRKIDGTNAIETKAFQKLKSALQDRADITESINLNERDSVIYPGGDIVISGAHFKLLCGFGKPMPEWHLTSDPAERLNGVSIVMKVEYGGNSVLFTGDALGRRKNDAESVCIATEKFLVENAAEDYGRPSCFPLITGRKTAVLNPFLIKSALSTSSYQQGTYQVSASAQNHLRALPELCYGRPYFPYRPRRRSRPLGMGLPEHPRMQGYCW